MILTCVMLNSRKNRRDVAMEAPLSRIAMTWPLDTPAGRQSSPDSRPRACVDADPDGSARHYLPAVRSRQRIARHRQRHHVGVEPARWRFLR
jgi:hypothetical protein